VHDRYTGANVRVGLCIRNANSAQYHKDRANVEFRLPQNYATVCFISKELSGGMTSFENRAAYMCFCRNVGVCG
jgi:hypothetical protein